MSLAVRVRLLWFRLNQPMRPSAHSSFTTIQRRARDLMSFASLLTFFAGGWWLLIAFLAWRAAYAPSTSADSYTAPKLLEYWHLLPTKPFDHWIVALAWLFGFTATVSPLVCLRRLGKSLYLKSPLSSEVANGFRALGHALSANIALGFAASWLAASQLANYQISFGSGLLATITAALLAYVVADLVRAGLQATEENREFV